MLPTSNVYLELDIDNKRGRVRDNSNYASENINVAQANAKGLGIVTVNNTAVFNGSLTSNPLVNLAVSSIGQWFNLPLDSNGNVLNGTYSFTYSLNFSASGSVDSVTTPNAAVLEFANIGQVLQAGDSIVFTGNTQTANNGTFTISTVTPDEGDDQTALTFTQTTLVNEVTPTGTYSVNVTRANFGGDTYTFNGCDFVKPCVKTLVDCDSTRFGLITFQDVTDYKNQIVLSRTLTGFYPRPLTPAPVPDSISTINPSLTFNTLAVGTWAYSLLLSMSVTQADGLVYFYGVSVKDEEKVVCVGSLCSLTPCLESLKDTFITNYYKGTGANLIPLVTAVNQLITLANEYKSCGNVEMYKETVLELQKLLNTNEATSCNCGCDDSDNTPYWVDNANFQAPSILEQILDRVETLESEVDNLNAELGNLQQAVLSDANALAAYNELIANIAALSNGILENTILAATIQANINSLDPNSSTFEDDVDIILGQLSALETDYLLLEQELADVTTELITFNTDFPAYANYTILAAVYLNSASEALDSVSDSISSLFALLNSLTPDTYPAQIEDLQNQINNLWAELNSVYGLLNAASLSIQEIGLFIQSLQNQIISVQNQVNQLQSDFNGVTKVRVFGTYIDESGESLFLYLPPNWVQQKITYKFNIKGVSNTDGLLIKLTNTNNDLTLAAFSVPDSVYDIEFNMIFSPADNVWKIGGVCNLETSMFPIQSFNIPLTTLPFDTATVLSVVIEVGGSNTFYALDAIAYKL
jgi:hypothetical protein